MAEEVKRTEEFNFQCSDQVLLYFFWGFHCKNKRCKNKFV